MFHDDSKEHKRCGQHDLYEKCPSEAPIEKIATKLSKDNEVRMGHLFNIAFAVAQEKMAFRKFPVMCAVVEKCGVDLGNNYKNDKACRAFVKCISEVDEKNLAEEIEGARFFCVLADGSTDCPSQSRKVFM